jgi:hypothetical protein
MNNSIDRLQRSVRQIRSKFEEVKALDGTAQDASPAGDRYVKISDEYARKGSASFDEAGNPTSFRLAEWDPNDSEVYSENEYSDNPEDSRIVEHYSISQHESGLLYFFSENSGTDSEGAEIWAPGHRIAVDPATQEIVGTFELGSRPGKQKFVPLTKD